MRFLDQLLARLGLVTGRRPHNPALDRELGEYWDAAIAERKAAYFVLGEPFASMNARSAREQALAFPPQNTSAVVDQAYSRLGIAEVHDQAAFGAVNRAIDAYFGCAEVRDPYRWYSLEELLK